VFGGMNADTLSRELIVSSDRRQSSEEFLLSRKNPPARFVERKPLGAIDLRK